MEEMKRLGHLVLLLFAVVAGASAQLAKTIPAPAGYVDDYAHVLTPDGSAQIETLCRQIHDQTKAQVFLVTVASLKGDSIEQFSSDLFHQWKIGGLSSGSGSSFFSSSSDDSSSSSDSSSDSFSGGDGGDSGGGGASGSD